MDTTKDSIEHRIERWQRLQRELERSETAVSRSSDDTILVKVSVDGQVDVTLDYERAEMSEDQTLTQHVIETYNSAHRRLGRGLRHIMNHLEI